MKERLPWFQGLSEALFLSLGALGKWKPFYVSNLSFQSSFHPSLSCFLSFCFCFYYPHQIVGIICLLGFFFKCLFIYLFILLISHPFYTHQCIHVNPNLPIYHTTTPTHRCFPPLVPIGLFSTSVSQFPLCKLVHLYHFLGSTYMR